MLYNIHRPRPQDNPGTFAEDQSYEQLINMMLEQAHLHSADECTFEVHDSTPEGHFESATFYFGGELSWEIWPANSPM